MSFALRRWLLKRVRRAHDFVRHDNDHFNTLFRQVRVISKEISRQNEIHEEVIQVQQLRLVWRGRIICKEPRKSHPPGSDITGNWHLDACERL